MPIKATEISAGGGKPSKNPISAKKAPHGEKNRARKVRPTPIGTTTKQKVTLCRGVARIWEGSDKNFFSDLESCMSRS